MERLDFIIDIQGYQDKEGFFLPKEITIVALDCNFVSHWIVKPPYDYDELPKSIVSATSYLTCYYHGLEWYDGESELEDVYSVLRIAARQSQNIYVRGNQKAKLLERVLGRHIVNVEEYGCPNFKNLSNIEKHYCLYHGRRPEYFACSLTGAYKLRIWLRKALYVSDVTPQERKKKKPARNIPVQDISEGVQKLVVSPVTSPRTGGGGGTIYEGISVAASGGGVGGGGVGGGNALAAATAIANGSGSGGEIEEPHYSKPYDELATDPSCTTLHTSTNRGCIPCRQDTEGVDEAGCYYC